MLMITLFTSVKQGLKSFLEGLSTDDIRVKIHSPAYYKGRDYLEDGWVEEVQYSSDSNRISASVAGSMDYAVDIELQQGVISADCSCPVDGLCKHISAVLLYAVQNKGAVKVAESREPNSPVAEHLASLSREELVALVMQFAPEDFFIEIRNRNAGEAEARATFQKAMAASRKLFKNSELLYEPDAFGKALVKQLQPLLGLERQLRQELSEYIFFIIREVDNAFDEGYLYEHYSDTPFEEPEEFQRMVENYLRTLPFAEKISFLKKLNETIEDAVYGTFDSLAKPEPDVFSESDLHGLKAMLLKDFQELPPSLTEYFYILVRPQLAGPEKERLLLYLSNINMRSWLHELIQLYMEQGREKEAIELIKNSLGSLNGLYSYEPIFILYLDLLQSQNMALEAACARALQHCPGSSMLEKIAEIRGGDTKQFEPILEQKNPGELLDFLEKRGRLAEALSLLKRNKNIWDEKRFKFFKTHKKSFPADAMQYFYDELDKHLQQTGNSHYQAIAEILEEILQVDPSRARALAADIRANYNRRRNLIALIRNI